MLRKLSEAADRNDVVLSRVDVREAPATGSRLGQLQLTLSAQGGYVDIKRFLVETLERHGSATVSRLRLTKDSSAPTLLQAELLLTVWAQPTSKLQ